MTTYAELVRELDSPHVSPRPSRSFVALVFALAVAPGWRTAADLVRASGVDQGDVSRILARLRRYGVVQRHDVDGRLRYRITVRGCALASSFYAERAS